MTLHEQVFRKIGAEIKPDPEYKGGEIYCWILNGQVISNSVHLEKYRDSLTLPPVSSQWEVCAKYLVPFMRERGFDYHIQNFETRLGKYFCWHGQPERSTEFQNRQAKILRNDIAEAACKAFMELKL